MVQSQTQQNYIGINGIVTQDLNSIIAELKNDFKGIYGENINLESNTSDGQWLNILAQQKIDALDFQVQLYNNLDVDSVVGLPQQVLYKLNGLTIKDFTYSFVYVNVTVSQNVSLTGLDGDIANTDGTGYTVTDMNGNNWILAESISLVTSETPYLLLFRAQELGQISALANTITNMSTIVAGVTEVNNPANNFITGQTGETAAEFRTRRNRSLQAPSQGFKESIEGQLLALNDVSDAKVYDNKDDANIDGVQVIVQGGTSNEIGNIIYNNLPPGINTQGAYEATITVNNRNKVLNYDKPNPIPILVKGTIESLTGNVNDVDINYVKQTLASKQFNIGEIAESANITTQLKNILGETGSPYDVELSLGATSGEWGELTIIGDSLYNKIIYNDNKYIAVGSGGKLATSSTLENWVTSIIGNDSSISWTDIIYDGTKYIVIGSDGTDGKIGTSTDLLTWVILDLVDKGVEIIYENGMYIITGNDGLIMSSSDLSTWNKTNLIVQNIYSRWNITYDGTKFIGVYVGSGGYVTTSTDAIAWTTPVENIGLGNANRIYYINNTYIVVGYGGLIATSADFIQFDKVFVTNRLWLRLAYTNGIYAIIGSDGIVATSSDLKQWTTTLFNNIYNSKNIISTDSNFVALFGNKFSEYVIPTPDWQEILTPTGLADFYVMTVSGMDDLEVIA